MDRTPLAAKILSAAMEFHGWTQAEFAKLVGLARTQVSQHLSTERPVRDDHLAQYAQALDKAEQSMLVSAWLRDCLPDAAAANVLEPGTFIVREEVRQWQPGLTAEQRNMLDWWAAKLAADDELDHIFKAISRKAGWQS